MDGGKQLYGAEAEVYFKEGNQSLWVRFGVDINKKHIFLDTVVTVSDGKLQIVMFD